MWLRRGYHGHWAGKVIGMVTLLSLKAALGATPEPSQVLGHRPGYGPVTPETLPNAAAVLRKIWVPGLDDGYDPQGLAIVDGAVIVSGYLSDSRDRHTGRCRVFRVDAETGHVTGTFDLPPSCRHAGGAAVAAGMLYVSDTHNLFALPLDRAFAAGDPPIRSNPLGPGLVGALAAGDGDAVWIGTYKEDGPGRIYRFKAATLRALGLGEALRPDQAARALDLPSYAQGAALDPDGKRLWVSSSDLDWGQLTVIDLATGATTACYPAAPGLEGIAFDAQGRLWGVSEAGVRHYYAWWFAWLKPFDPLILALDPARLDGRCGRRG